MVSLDHTIVRVTDAIESARFYSTILGFTHEGKMGPFEIVRVNDGLTLDLLQVTPHDPQHLAFELPEQEFDRVFEKIRENDVAYGGGPTTRDNQGPGVAYGSRGKASAVFFSDPDGHNLEIRHYKDKQA